LGVVLYILLVGHLPFDENNVTVLFRKIVRGDFAVPSYISYEARDLIYRMLNPDPIGRITMSQVLHHPFYKLKLPIYLKISEHTVGKTLPSAHSYKANKTAKRVFD
jgi:serine/threonine protein kinase